MSKVYLPYDKKRISQNFGANATPLYSSQGLKGHTSTDWDVPFGTPIPNCTEDAYCYSVLNRNNPDHSKYRAVYMISEDETGVYEISYGHCSKILAEVGKTYRPGTAIAHVGNTGDVYDGTGRYIPASEKQKGSTAGSHLHGPQVRVLEKVKKRTGRKCLSDSQGIFKKDGYYYEVKDYNNGYNGCIPVEYESMLATDRLKEIALPLIADKLKDIVKEVPTLPKEAQPKVLTLLERVILELRKWITR